MAGDAIINEPCGLTDPQEIIEWTPVHEIGHLLMDHDDEPDICSTLAPIDQSVRFPDCVHNPPQGPPQFLGWFGADHLLHLRGQGRVWWSEE